MQLIEQRTALINQLRSALADYYPAALEAFSDWTRPGAWAFIAQFPTPHALVDAGRRQWERFLHTHKIWREATAESRLVIFARAEQLQGAAPTIAAKNLLAVSLVKLLQPLEAQLEIYRARITACFARHPPAGVFGPTGRDGAIQPRQT